MKILNLMISLLFLFSFSQIPAQAAKKSYVVYLGTHSHGFEPSSTLDIHGIAESHYELLGSCMKSKDKAREAIFYSYTHYINGFAAILEDEEVHEISRRPEVVSVFANEENELHTTRSWEFLGLEKNGQIPADSLWRKGRFGEDVIIGNLDTGVWPESESFNDDEMGPIPSKWKGKCDTNDKVKCNKKLIGARYFNKGYLASLGTPLNTSHDTARDTNGHGTHTLATAAGRFVSGANFLGSANGTAKGGAPNARVVSYKVCWPSCFDADVLAAFDAAISDGVDILSVSLGSRPRFYFNHAISIGSFHAVANGILVVCSAGNSGPSISSSSNTAPWIFTVAASTIDRNFTSSAVLGNKKIYKGLSFNTNTLPAKKFYPLINALDAKGPNDTFDRAHYCVEETLDPSKVKGKIVYCDAGFNQDIEKSYIVGKAGGIGVILSSFFTSTPEAHFIPTAVVSLSDGPAILTYINSTKSPVAYISGATEVGKDVAPVMASFSSLGPNAITPDILKPDITAPGVNILAAFTKARGSTNTFVDHRHLPFNILSGTSMSCPHVSGVAALLKSLHPYWSPAAIRSAIMTTASTRTNTRKPILNETQSQATPFNYGSGHIRPNRAKDPGLVYDLGPNDYLNFLCSIGYNKTQILTFNKSHKCSSANSTLLNFNYPSMSVPNLSGNATLTRTLKNVGNPGTYKVRVKAPKGVIVKVDPRSLKFTKISEEKNFKVMIIAKGLSRSDGYVFGTLVWSDGVHNVRSPIAVKKSKK
ncbi:subtilisin-like protease SBT5.3 [Mercurialis annua]|uniref:subtilisin-like protease SBT5.3 n=1 Tax=Mercurialis annua TaxID=3986 RepID=UPI00215E9846|nr:subtilisin-like protease SBT5.3 [Mercurialis annua]